MNKKTSIGLAAGVGLAIGFTVWALSAKLTGAAEPWDANFWLYALALFVPAGVLGFFIPKHARFAYLGIWLGQAIAIVVLPGMDRSWLALGVLSTAFGGLLGLLGYVAGAAIRARTDKAEP